MACLYAICDEYLKNIPLVDINFSKTHNMSMIIDFVEQNHKKDITLHDVAELLGYEYHYVSRLFHTLFNMSFKDFLCQ